MKTVSLKKKNLVDALGQVTHPGFDRDRWSWQVVFDSTNTQAEGRVVLVNPDVDEEVNYRLVNEEGYNVLDFADLNGFTWDADSELAQQKLDDIKELEQIHLPEETRNYIRSRLRQHVQIGKDEWRVEYY